MKQYRQEHCIVTLNESGHCVEMLKIDKNVPVLSLRGSRKETIRSSVPWQKLKVGDSVLIPNRLLKGYKNAAGTITGSAWREGIVVSIRSVPEGIRIWRKK